MVAASALGLLFSWTGVLVVLLSIIHVIVCIFLLAVVLLQRGRTGDVMSAFGGPTPSSYAALSTDDLLTRMTKIGAATFMVTSLALALLASRTETSVLGDEDDEALPAASAPAEVAPAEASAAVAPAESTMPASEIPAGETTPTGETAPTGDAAPPEGAAPAESVPPAGTAPSTP